VRLEQLEDRVVPAFISPTYTNASIQITPGLTVTEKVTVSVTPFGSFNSSTGVTTPPPTTTAPAGGTVAINLNNMQQTATLNSNGQATFTFNVPLLAFLTSQQLEISFQSFTDGSGDFYEPSFFSAPIYKNFNNVLILNMLLPSTITFNLPTPQQLNPPTSNGFVPFNTVAGEMDSVAGGLVTYNYVDPGTIQTVSTPFGVFAGFPAAFQLGAYGGFSPK
jgi:hypothetical protein